MTPGDFAAALGLVFLIFAAVAGCVLGFRYGTMAMPAACPFDGGTLASGNAARTSDGQAWACGSGRLYRLPGRSPASWDMPPAGLHWRYMHGPVRDCGDMHGQPAIVLWRGNGDLKSAVICPDGTWRR